MQRDLFQTTAAAISAEKQMPAQKPAFLERYRFSLRFDQALFVSIGFLIVSALVFSLGVEKGKRFALEEIKAERAKREQLADELAKKVFALQPKIQADPASGAGAQSVEEIKPVETGELQVQVEAAKESDEASESVRPQGKYTIQIVTYKAQSAAERQVKKLVEKGLQGFVLPNGNYMIVCVDAFESQEKARLALTKLKAKGMIPVDAYVRTIPI